MSNPFKVGDKVRYIYDDSYHMTIGKVYTYVDNRYTERDPHFVTITMDNGNPNGFPAKYFELAESREMSKETLIKRAKLGIKSMGLLYEKYPEIGEIDGIDLKLLFKKES